MKVHVEPLVRALLDGVQEPRDATGRATGEPVIVDRLRVDLGVVPVFSDERPLLGLAGLIDWRGSGCLSKLVRSGFCSLGYGGQGGQGEQGEQVLLPCDRRLPVDRLVLVGLGPREHYDEARARALAEQSVRVALGLQSSTVLIALPSHGKDRTLTEVAFQSLISTIHDRERADQERADRERADRERADRERADQEREQAEARERELPDSGEGDPTPSDPVRLEPAPDSHDPEHEASDADVTQPSNISSVRWWVAADEAVVARLRRVLSGPPRATRGGAGLHT
jgi:Cytosol aminopeptidase family, N-terminal domain